MGKTKFVYVTYIRTTQEKLFEALTKGEITRQYWMHDNVSDWKVGSPWKHVDKASAQVRIVGEVLESAPPRRLVISWASPDNTANKKKPSRVAFHIEPVEDMVRRTLTADKLEAGSAMERGRTP